MTMINTVSFDSSSLLTEDAFRTFERHSVVFANDLFEESLCHQALDYFLLNEQSIIHNYSHDYTKLVLDNNDECSTPSIKYFECPLQTNRWLFGRFLTSTVFDVAKFLLGGDPICLFSVEIHSRGPNGSPIPLHQDNAYYGLEQAKGITFYIALNNQSSDNGGLRYISTRRGVHYDHIASSEKAFSLTTSTPIRGTELFTDYKPGFCSIHSGSSAHYASSVPSTASRSIALRLSLYSLHDKIRPDHKQWYDEMVRRNRLAP